MAYSRTLNHFTSMQELATIWASSTSYVVNQLVIQSDKLYRCLVAHTSGGTFIADLQAAYWVEISASEAGVFNYIGNPDAEVDASGWTTYAESDSVAFTDAGDLVTLNNHGLSNGNEISFTSITSTTGISVNTRYFVVSATTNTFQVASSSGGSALPLTTNGSGTMVRFVPKTGSGGSPNITWSRSIVSPLRGDADFNLVKDAANRQGQGVEYDFTIDNADLAKVLTVTFDYEVVSGTFATGDVTVYLIQDPSGTPLVIQPAGYQVQGATVGTKMRQIATFQTSSTVTSYRLCLHVSSVSASAYTLAVDNVVVGPQVVQYGAPVTDWQDYTFTIGATTTAPTFGTTTVNKARYRRVGDSMEISWQILQTSAGTAGSGNYLFPLPSGFSIDTAKLTVPNATASQNVVGTISLGTASILGVGTVYAYDSTRLQAIFVQDGGGIGGNTWGSSYIALNNASVYGGFTARVPILGWSSTVQMSNDTDTRVVAFAATGTVAATAANTALVYPTTTFDTHGGYNATTGKYTIPVPGVYRFTASVFANHGGSTTFQLYKNNVAQTPASGSADANGFILGSFLQSFVAGDVIDVRANNASTASSLARNLFAAERLSGPSAIAASESVTARFTTATAQAIGSATIVNFTTAVFDSHGAVTTGANWKFTAPISGKYRVSAMFFTAATTLAQRFQYSIYKGGVDQSIWLCDHEKETTNSSRQVGSGSTTINLLAGEYIDLRGSATGATTNLSGDAFANYIAIERIGN